MRGAYIDSQRGRSLLFVLLMAVLPWLISLPASSQTLTNGDYRTIASGVWSNDAIWERYNGTTWVSDGTYPVEVSAPTNISVNHNVTVDLGLGYNSGDRIINLYVNSGTLELSTWNFRVNGVTVIAGRLSDASISGTDTFVSAVTVTATGVWNTIATTAAYRMYFYSDVTHNNTAAGSFTASGVVRFNGTGTERLQGAGPMEFDYVYISNGTTLRNQNTNTVTVNYRIDATDTNNPTWFNDNGSTLLYKGSDDIFPTNPGTLNAATAINTVIYAATGAANNVYSTTYHHLTIAGTGNKRLTGPTTVNGNITINSVLSAQGFAINLYGNWTDNGTFNHNNNTVYLLGSSAQTISAETFYRLVINGSGTKNLTGNVSIVNLLTMTLGNVSTGTNRLILRRNTSAGLSYTSGTIIGNFERYIGNTGANYLFPVGTATQRNSATFLFNNLPVTTGSIVVSFVPNNPGTAGLPATDPSGGYTIVNTFSTGYWTALAQNGLTTTNYNVSLDIVAFGPYTINTSTRVLKRTDTSGNWGFDGTHQIMSGTLARRQNLSGGISSTGGGSQFCAGATGATITDQPDDVVACQGSTATFTVAATGYGTLTYRWYKEPSTALVNGADYTGVTTTTLRVLNVDVNDNGRYYCVVTDGNGDAVPTYHAVLTVPYATFGNGYAVNLIIDQASGGTNLIDFPVLVRLTQTYLRTIANGGHVANANGWDIVFTDAANNRLDHEIEYYDGTTGTYVAWVRVPVLNAGSTTTIRMLYGDASVTANPSRETTWISSYKGVWHLSNSLLDATATNNDGTNHSTTNVTGLIVDARYFNGSNTSVEFPANQIPRNHRNQTISVWANYASSPSGTQNMMVVQSAANATAVQLGFRDSELRAWRWGGASLVEDGAPPSTNTWHYYVYTFDGYTHSLYRDGALMNTDVLLAPSGIPDKVLLGCYYDITNSPLELFTGNLDEARFSMSEKTAGWIATEYNNQVNPEDFIAVGAETSNTTLESVGICNSYIDLVALPAGGTFSGPGVTGTRFYPATAGVGTHTIIYNVSYLGCNLSTSKTITVTPGPAAPAAESRYCCNRNVVDLEANGVNLRWYSDAGLTNLVGWGSPFATGANVSVTTVFTYYVTQTVNGCQSPATMVTLTVYPNTAVGGTASATPLTFCQGSSATFSLTGQTGHVTGWQRKLTTDATWTDIPGTEATSITDAPPTAGSWQYRAVVSVGECGSAYSSAVTVTANADVTPPVISGCPTDITVQTGLGNTTCTQTATWTEPTATDNCAGALTYSDRSHVPGSAFSVGTTIVTYTFEDNLSNESTCSFNVIVQDNTAPTITCAVPAASYTADAGRCDYTVPGTAPDPTTTDDNCGIQSVVNDFSGTSTLQGAVFPVGTTTVVWTITDIHSNSTTCSYNVVVEDKEKPTFDVPADITICRALDCSYDTDPAITGIATNESDNCSTGITATYGDNTDNLTDCLNAGYITRTWSLSDFAGNTTTHDQIIWIQPVPAISVVVPDTLICNESVVNFSVDSLVVSRGTVMYNLDVTYPIGVSGTLTDGSRTIENITDQLVNTTTSYQTVTYTFEPYIQGKPGDPTCYDGIDTTITIHVQPTARVVSTIANNEICNGETVSVDLTSPTAAYNGTEFDIEVLNDYPEVSGYTSQTALTFPYTINETLTNTGDTARLIRYVVKPYLLDISGSRSCDGINDTIGVWVNPTPRVVVKNNATAICSGGQTDIVLTSPTVMSSGDIQFDYTVVTSAPAGIVDGDRNPATDVDPGTPLIFVYTNSSDTIQTVSYIVTPKVNGGPACANGDNDTVTVEIHAVPIQGLFISKPITCEGGSDGALEVVPSKGADPYTVVWTKPMGSESGTNLFYIDDLMNGPYSVVVTDNLGCSSSASITLTAPKTEVNLYATDQTGAATGYNVSCNGGSDATIILRVDEGYAPPFDYWIVRNDTDTLFTGSLTDVFDMWDPTTYLMQGGVSAGTYEAIIRDANGCYDNAIYTVTEPAPVEVNFGTSQYTGGFNISCEGYNDGSAWISSITGGIAPYTYSWSTGSVTDRIDNVVAGTYILTVTDAALCISQFPVTLTEPDGIDTLDVNISMSKDGIHNISCFGGNDGAIDITFDGTYLYNWSRAGDALWSRTTEDISSLTADDYHLVVTDSKGCVKTYDFTLTQPDQIAVTASTADILCHNGTGNIDVTVSGGSGLGFAYLWTMTENPSWSATTEDLTSVTAGTYHLAVTDLNKPSGGSSDYTGCISELTVSMTEPDAILLVSTVSDVTCSSPSFDDGSIHLDISGGTAPYSVLWAPNGETTPDISGLTAGTYDVTVTDANLCTATLSVTVKDPEPVTISSAMSDYNGYQVSCHGLSNGWISVDAVTGTGPFSYSWSGDGGFTSTADSVYNLAEGQYTVTVTDSKMCTFTGTFDIVAPGQIGMAMDISTSLDGNYNINCAGAGTGEVGLTANNAVGDYSFVWSDGGTGNYRNDLRAGSYVIIITDENNCSAKDTVTLTEPYPILLAFDSVKPYCNDSNDGMISVLPSGGVDGFTYLWNTGSVSQDITNADAGVYTVTVTDANGCTVKGSVDLVAEMELCLIIPNAFSPNDDGINDVWHIGRIDLYPEAEVFVLNRWGQLMWQSTRGYTIPWDGKSKGKLLPMDSYHYTIDLHNGSKPVVGHVTIVK